MDTCKWYVSVEKPECGEPAVATITQILLRSGAIKKLVRPMGVCSTHKAESDRRSAAMRASRR